MSAPEDESLQSVDTQHLLARARGQYEALEFEEVARLTREILRREDIDIALRLDAYWLQGSALAIVGDPVAAEKPFRFLLRGRPDFQLPASAPPKIAAVFRKVQVEERAIVDQMRELERKRIVQQLELTPEVPSEGAGGVPLLFLYRLKDPRGAVSTMKLHYRREGEKAFSSLTLQMQESGDWTAEIPGEWTASEARYRLEYYVDTQSEAGMPLLTVGEAQAPLAVPMAPGVFEEPVPLYQEWWFWAATVGVTAAFAGAGALLYHEASKLPETQGLVKLD